jgi:hypothetical protein
MPVFEISASGRGCVKTLFKIVSVGNFAELAFLSTKLPTETQFYIRFPRKLSGMHHPKL